MTFALPPNADALIDWSEGKRDGRSLPRKAQHFASIAKGLIEIGDLRGALWMVLRHSRSPSNRNEAMRLLGLMDDAP